MTDRLPLPALLSQALVAFTIEFDNESEHRMAHQTTRGGGAPGERRGPWLVSQVMWANVMRLVSAEGVRVADLHARARTTRDSLAGLQRWGYVTVTPGPAAGARKPPAETSLVRATSHGRAAQEVWRPLAGIVEERWRGRLGSSEIGALRGSLEAVVGRLGMDLPRYLPVVYPTQNGKTELAGPRQSAAGSGGQDGAAPDPSALDLSALLSQVLHAFTIDFERASALSLAVSANTLRVLGEAAVPVRDLPRLTGVSKEANSMAAGFLERHGCLVVEPDPAASRGKVMRLTGKGQRAQHKYRRILRETEDDWRARFGDECIAGLATSLERMTGDGGALAQSPLARGLEPYPDGWRASVRKPGTLPQYPMGLHRGGFPDGS